MKTIKKITKKITKKISKTRSTKLIPIKIIPNNLQDKLSAIIQSFATSVTKLVAEEKLKLKKKNK